MQEPLGKTENDLFRVPSLIKEGERYLLSMGVSEPGINSRIIAEYVFSSPLHRLFIEDIIPARADIKRFVALVAARGNGIPVQYLTGRATFFGRDFLVEEGVFIPRPETEILVEAAINICRQYSGKRIDLFDVCTGSGIVGITVAREVENIRVVMTDNSRRALSLAGKNASLHGVSRRVDIEDADIFPAGERSFDIITANPPYIKRDEIPSLQKEVLREPSTALDGGEDGMDLIRKIIRGAPCLMSDPGYLLLEVGQSQAGEVARLGGDLQMAGIIEDLAGIDRVAIFKKQSKNVTIKRLISDK